MLRALRALEEQRRPAGLDGAVDDLGDLEVGIDLGGDADELALALEQCDPVAEVCGRRHAAESRRPISRSRGSAELARDDEVHELSGARLELGPAPGEDEGRECSGRELLAEPLQRVSVPRAASPTARSSSPGLCAIRSTERVSGSTARAAASSVASEAA